MKHLIKHTGIGRCNELAEYLSTKISRLLQQHKINARIQIVDSSIADHVYLRIAVKLDNEHISLWEVDAWHPRIIDVSKRKKSSISQLPSLNKNHNALAYGLWPNVQHKFFTKDYEKKGSKKFELNRIRKPKQDSEEQTKVTPSQEEMQDIYSDYTIEDSYAEKLLPVNGKLTHLQKASKWQIQKS